MSDISCDCSCDVDWGPSFCTDTIRKARKEHQCCECADTIHPGQKYERVFGVWDGSKRTFITCLPCVAIRERYCPNGWLYGRLVEQIQECLQFDYTRVPPEYDWDEIDEEDAANVAAHRRRSA